MSNDDILTLPNDKPVIDDSSAGSIQRSYEGLVSLEHILKYVYN